MAISVTSLNKSLGLVCYAYNITGLVNGSNSITLPTPPAAGSFPPSDDWIPTVILCFPYNTGAVGAVVTPDYSTLAETALGVVSFTLYASGNTDVLIFIY